MKVAELYRTCIACPEQYEGTTECGKEIYVRCRGGYARLELDDEIIAELSWEDDPYKGMFENQELFELFDKAGIELDSKFIEPYGVEPYGYARL